MILTGAQIYLNLRSSVLLYQTLHWLTCTDIAPGIYLVANISLKFSISHIRRTGTCSRNLRMQCAMLRSTTDHSGSERVD
jgi:hypothetical protein